MMHAELMMDVGTWCGGDAHMRAACSCRWRGSASLGVGTGASTDVVMECEDGVWVVDVGCSYFLLGSVTRCWSLNCGLSDPTLHETRKATQHWESICVCLARRDSLSTPSCRCSIRQCPLIRGLDIVQGCIYVVLQSRFHFHVVGLTGACSQARGLPLPSVAQAWLNPDSKSPPFWQYDNVRWSAMSIGHVSYSPVCRRWAGKDADWRVVAV